MKSLYADRARPVCWRRLERQPTSSSLQMFLLALAVDVELSQFSLNRAAMRFGGAKPLLLLVGLLGACSASLQWSHSVELSPNYTLSWSPDEQSISFRLEVRTLGFVGLGFSPNGGMTHADIIMVWVDDTTGQAHIGVSVGFFLMAYIFLQQIIIFQDFIIRRHNTVSKNEFLEIFTHY